MNYIDEIFEKISIRGVADYLLFGLAPNKDTKDYKARIEEISVEYEKAVEKYDKNATSELLDKANAMTCEVASVYTEIGLQAGILLMKDMLENLGITSRGDSRQADYQAMYFVLFETITHALELLEDSNDKIVEDACRILKNGQCRSEAIYIRSEK